MKLFKEYQNRLPRIEPIHRWYYIENGSSHGPFKEKPNKKICELVAINKDHIIKRNQENKERDRMALLEWKHDLRQEYSHIGDDLFELCYERAFECSHSYGYDQIVGAIEDVIEFSFKVIDVLNKED